MRSPVVGCIIGAVFYLAFLGLSAGVIDATHSDIAGEAVAVLGVAMSAYAAASYTLGPVLDRVVAGAVPVLLALVLNLGVAVRYSRLTTDSLAYALLIVVTGSFAVAMSVRDAREG